jgi:hypothetical protein
MAVLDIGTVRQGCQSSPSAWLPRWLLGGGGRSDTTWSAASRHRYFRIRHRDPILQIYIGCRARVWGTGEDVAKVVQWLERGGIGRETRLRKALESAPRLGLAPAELGAHRWDGFRGLLAPRLRGEGNWPRLTLASAPEARMVACLDALLGRLPFWLEVCMSCGT